MQSTQFSIFVILGGFALYPFFVNQSKQQHQNACFVLGAVLLAIATTPSFNTLEGAIGAFGAVIYFLSYLFYAAALIKNDHQKGTFRGKKLLAFLVGGIVSFGIMFINQVYLTIIFSLLQLSCLLYFSIQRNQKPEIETRPGIAFSVLYFVVTITFFVSLYSATPSAITNHTSDFAVGLLLALTTLHLVFQDFTRSRIKNQRETKLKIDYEALKLMYRSKRVIKDFQHDLRQPLSTVGILASVGKAISKDPEVTARYQHIQTAQRALKGLIESLFEQLNHTLKYPVESDALPLVEFRIDEIIIPLVEEYRLLASHKNLQIRYVPTNAMVTSNKNALTKILRNGLDNAIKYTTSGGVVVGTRRKSNGVCIQIADTGSGIENDQVAKHDKGWGHGSQIIQELSEQISATTLCKNRYYDSKLAGSRFEVFLPSEGRTTNPQDNATSNGNQLNACVLCTDEQELAEAKRHIPQACFDEVQFSLKSNTKWNYRNLVRNCKASVFIRFAKTIEAKQKAIEEMRTLSALLEGNPCCIVVYDASLKKNPHIEFMNDFICIPINTRVEGGGVTAIEELFPPREAGNHASEQHSMVSTKQHQRIRSNESLTTP